uniref:Uncharacterized protein n=2 Tax=Ascaris lumbricoides TaxID=6252 RepID=A0A0M3HG22_ASCLU
MINSNTHGADFSAFMEHQKCLTKTIFVSLLFVLPSIYQYIVMFTSSQEFADAISPYTILPSLFNSVNEASVLFIRQGEVREVTIKMLIRHMPKCCRKKNFVLTVKSFNDNSAATFPSTAK